MPLYTYQCSKCDQEEDIYASVAARDEVRWNCECGGNYARKFTPSSQVLIPARFGVTRGWHLPDTRAGWEDMGTVSERSTVHAPDNGMKEYGEHLEKTLRELG